MHKLNHALFSRELNTHVTPVDHFCREVALGVVSGMVRCLESLGFRIHDPKEIDRILLEHLSPDYQIENIKSDVVRIHHISENQFTRIADQFQNREESEDNPFRSETNEKLKELYLDPNHSEKFWENYEKIWLPKRLNAVEKRKQSLGFLQKRTQILARNPWFHAGRYY